MNTSPVVPSSSRTIARDLTLGLVVTVGLVMTLVGLSTYLFYTNQAERNLQARADQTADRLASVLELPLWNVDESTVEQISRAYLQAGDVASVQVTNEDGDVLFEEGSGPTTLGAITETRDMQFNQQDVGSVRVTFSTEATLETRRGILINTVVTLVVTVAALIIANRLLLNRFLTQPLNRLAEGLKTIAGGEYHYRLPPASQYDMNTIHAQVNSMAAQIEKRDSAMRNLINTLEMRVNNRTRDMTLAAEVSKQITRMLTLDDLLPAIAEKTRESFDLYQVTLFLYDEDSQTLILRGATGEPGQQLLARNYTLTIDEKPSLVANVARSRESITVNDVTKAQNHLHNPLLPDVRSEIVLPMIIGGRLIGVMDVMSTQVDRFDKDDERALTTLADQMAIAVQNAQLYAEQVRVAEELRDLDKLKTEFIANMSHELRTPLNSVLNFTEFVANGVFGEINQEQKEALQRVLDSSEHLLGLINDILDLSKIEAGMLELFKTDVDIKQLLESVSATGTGLVREKPVELQLDISDELPVLHADKRRLRQVILNLLSNAIKFTQEGAVTLSARTDNADLVIAVKDTGIGIAEEDLGLIFEKFQQVEHGIEVGPSTGLGLPITRHLIEMHDGTIDVSSTLGEGTTFTITLPIKERVTA